MRPRNPIPIFNKAIRQEDRFGRPIDEFLRRVHEQPEAQPAEEDDPDEIIQINFMPNWDDLSFPLTIENFVDFPDTQTIFRKGVEVGMIETEVVSIKYQVEGQSTGDRHRREMKKGNEEDFFQLLEDIETQRADNQETGVSIIVIKVGPVDESTMMDKYAA